MQEVVMPGLQEIVYSESTEQRPTSACAECSWTWSFVLLWRFFLYAAMSCWRITKTRKRNKRTGKPMTITPSPTSKGYIAMLINDQNSRLLSNKVSGSVTIQTMTADGLHKTKQSTLFRYFLQQKMKPPTKV